MPENKSLKDIFKKYIPTSERERQIFEESHSASLSGDRERKMYEVHFSLPFVAAKKDLYRIEECI